MATAARAGDAERYRAALRVAQHQGFDEEQMTDAYQWGRRGLGPAAFDWHGMSEEPNNDRSNTPDLLDSVDQLD